MLQWNLPTRTLWKQYQGLIQDFLVGGGGGGGGILASDSISGQDIGICIVCFGLLLVFVFWYFDIVPNILNYMLRLI